MDTFTTYQYADFSKIDEWDADELMAALCDLPVSIEVHNVVEEIVPSTPIQHHSPRNTGRTSEIIHQLQADVEKMHFLLLQQTEEIYFLKSRIEKIEEKQKKNINTPKKIPHGQSKGLYPKRSTSQDISSTHLDYARQIKSRRS
jgi:hypothetical protein